MRIIAGRYKGHTISAPAGHRTHPMSDKIRGALFNVLGDIEGLTLLDAYAGTGACAIEAASRGVMHATAIDSDKNAVAVIKKNVRSLGIETYIKVTQANASSWSDTNQLESYDIVLLDPPYDDVKPRVLEKLARHAGVGGIVVVSLPPEQHVEFPSGAFEHLATKDYGDATLSFYRRIG